MERTGYGRKVIISTVKEEMARGLTDEQIADSGELFDADWQRVLQIIERFRGNF